MKEKIIQIDKENNGIRLPDDFLRHLELIAGAEVELVLDKKKNWIVLRPLHGDEFGEFFEHYKESMESMA
jgi:antitoxin component of MazEF toxin-antitoxin module